MGPPSSRVRLDLRFGLDCNTRRDSSAPGRGHDTCVVPPARSDRRLLFLSTAAVIAGGLAMAGAILFSTGRSSPPEDYEPFAAGPQRDLERQLGDGGPFFFADVFGGDRGFWFALEGDEVVAIAARQTDRTGCTVRWRATLDRFVCGDDRFTSEQLQRFLVTVRRGDDQRILYVDLRCRIAAPQPVAGTEPDPALAGPGPPGSGCREARQRSPGQ